MESYSVIMLSLDFIFIISSGTLPSSKDPRPGCLCLVQTSKHATLPRNAYSVFVTDTRELILTLGE